MKLSNEDIQTIKNFFNGKPVLKAYLFGSYSRGDADINSDLDILVELDYTQHIGLGFVKMQLDLSNKLKKNVDMVSAQGLSPHLSPFINNNKQLIYER